MFGFLQSMLDKGITKERNQRFAEIAELLKTDVDALSAFESAYAAHALADDSVDDKDFFEINAKQAAEMHMGIPADKCDGLGNESEVHVIISRIVEELISITPVWSYDGKNCHYERALKREPDHPVTNEDLKRIPEPLRPKLTGSLMQVEIRQPSCFSLLETYQMYQKEKNPDKKQNLYGMFRQGLDLLDLDPVTYEMIGTNPMSMGHWLPQIAEAARHQDFFKIPKTTVIKVPPPMLQLTRLDYYSMNRTTLDIVDRYCGKVFNLDEEKEYFIKTGTYSSKFDFRNAHVHGAREVRELGEYLLFIHHQALMMSGPFNNRCIYGASTTNEWVVREFIQDKENNPAIYKGLPLHTEYRVFVDFDAKEILGMNPYWDPEVMKQRLGNGPDADNPHNVHDYITYLAHEETLMKRYHCNKDAVLRHVEDLLQDVEGLSGQWSLDIMQNGEDFWIIDMALAANSALNECVPKEKIKKTEENWIPEKGQLAFL